MKTRLRYNTLSLPFGMSRPLVFAAFGLVMVAACGDQSLPLLAENRGLAAALSEPPQPRHQVYMVDSLINAVYPVSVVTSGEDLLAYPPAVECAAEHVEWAAGQTTCSSPFAFIPPCQGRDAYCAEGDPNVCAQANFCDVFHGDHHPRQYSFGNFAPIVETYPCDEGECRVCDEGGCELEPCWGECDRLLTPPECFEMQEAFFNQKRAEVEERNREHVLTGSSYNPETGFCYAEVKMPVLVNERNLEECGCEIQDWIECDLPASLCDPANDWAFSAPNQELNAITGCQNAACKQPYGDYQGATCMTCEHIPLSELARKLECLQTTSGFLTHANFPPEHVETTLADINRQKRLLLEMRSAALELDQLETLLDAYQTTHQPETACGSVVTLPQLPPSCGSDAQMAIEMCQRLRQAGKSATRLASLAFERCLDVYETLFTGAPSTPECNGPQHRDLLRLLTTELLRDQLETIHSDSNSGGLGELARQLPFLCRWFDVGHQTLNPDPESTHVSHSLVSDLEVMTAELWRHAYAASFEAYAAAAADGTVTTEDLDALRKDVRAVEQAILANSFAVPSCGAPLLLLTHDSLQPTAERIENLSELHDLACGFTTEGCLGDPDTVVSHMWRILASLADPMALATNVQNVQATFADDGGEDNGWHTPLTAVADNQQMLLAAMEAVPGLLAQGEHGTMLELARLPTYARPLATLLRRAIDVDASYQATGFFLSAQGRRVLNTKVSHNRREEVATFVRGITNDLAGNVAAYESNLVTLTQGVIAQLQNSAQQHQMEAEYEQSAQEYDTLTADLAGLSFGHNEQQALSGRLLETFLALDAQSPEEERFTAIEGLTPQGDPLSFNVDGQDGRHTGGSKPIGELSVQTIPNLQTGQMLSVNTTGMYSPTCAISQTQIAPLIPGGDPRHIQTSVTGPEGFMVAADEEDYVAQDFASAHTEAHRFYAGLTEQLCVNYTSSPLDIGIGFAAITASACQIAGYEFSKTMSTTRTDSEGRRSRTTASFAAGLRLRSTPFRGLPAGALLVVLTVKDTSRIVDVHVVQKPQTQIMLPVNEEALDAHFVVNDRACTTADTSHSLSVTVQRYIGNHEVAKAALKGMAAALDDFAAKEETYLAQGRLTPHQMQLARAEARVHVDEALVEFGITGGFAVLDPPLQDLFDSFVLQQIVRLERALEMQTIERELERKRLRLHGLQAALANQEEVTRLGVLVPRMALRNLYGARCRDPMGEICDLGASLRDEVELVLRVARDYFFPILRLWYPQAVTETEQDPDAAGALNTLRSTGLNKSALTIARAAVTFLNVATDKYLLDRFVGGMNEDVEEQPKVVVSFPRPNLSPSPFTPGSSLFRTANAVDAAVLWDAAHAGEVGAATIRPEYIYFPEGGINGVLDCSDTLPIVENAVLYLVHSYPSKFWEGSWLPVETSRSQYFAGADGPMEYMMVGLDDHLDPNAGDANLRFKFDLMEGPSGIGGPNGPIYRFEHEWSQHWRTVGLSPFASFNVDFAGLYANYPDLDLELDVGVTEILMLMEVDVTPGPDMNWVETCPGN